MARKQQKAKKMLATAETRSQAQEPKPMAVRLELPTDIHRLLRKLAADEGMSMSAYARDYFEQHIKDETRRRGLK